MEHIIINFKKTVLGELKAAADIPELKKINSRINSFLKEHSSMVRNESLDNKRKYGILLNEIREESKEIYESKIRDLENFQKKNESKIYDFTFCKKNKKYGSSHPLISLSNLMEKIFIGMDFSIVSGPEIELDVNNFEKLNMAPHHPARDMQDTFYVRSPKILLRSHTSSVQIRCMENLKNPPVRIISPGTVYRVDDIDPQHTPMFYQLEGLVVDVGVTFANLKAILITLLQNIFDSDTQIRFRPSYYPYTEPSAAVDIGCPSCSNGCQICAHSKWITVLGAGMVHPQVLKNGGFDPEIYTGFAFGLGINRLALIYYNLGEIRKLYENDISLWRQLN